MRILVTGGAGFVGSAVVRHLIKDTDHVVVNLDKLTYAGNLESIAEVADSPRYHFERGDICDPACVRPLFARYQPQAIMHLAAESHVDRSIDGPAEFVQTNVLGTYTLLEAAREHCLRSAPSMGNGFRFLHVSTDEVYGSLGRGGAFNEQSPYRPNSPYAATKAAADHLVRAWGKTYGLSVITTHCTNCYGPYQFPEKLIPLIILTGLAGKALPVYGRGDNVRDWLHVDDHARALTAALERGVAGETYNIGGRDERTNLEVVHGICELLDELAPLEGGRPHASLISFVADRPGHDFRYAVDSTKITRELGWRPLETFTTGLRGTVRWYLDDPDWCHRALLVRGLGHDSEPASEPAGERLASAA